MTSLREYNSNGYVWTTEECERMFSEKTFANLFSCPKCKSKMEETEHHEERGIVFIWFKCSQPDCCGQWLQKIPSYTAAGLSSKALFFISNCN